MALYLAQVKRECFVGGAPVLLCRIGYVDLAPYEIGPAIAECIAEFGARQLDVVSNEIIVVELPLSNTNQEDLRLVAAITAYLAALGWPVIALKEPEDESPALVLFSRRTEFPLGSSHQVDLVEAAH